MLRKEPEPGEQYRHFKGGQYQIITIAKHTETNEKMVVYQALYKDHEIFVRPCEQFMEKLDSAKYPEAEQEYRFEKIEEENGVNDILMMFLEATTIHEKLTVIRENKNELDEKLINDIAAAIDVVIEEKPLEEQISELISCLETIKRFEVGRLR